MTRQEPGAVRSTEMLLAEHASILHGTMVIGENEQYRIELSHQRSDACVWTVRFLKKSLFFKRLTSSHWFINEQQAFAYAVGMRNEHIRYHGDRDAGERQHHGTAV
jgi:hypothetical protein